LKQPPISNVVLEYFQKAENISGTTCDILKYYTDTYGQQGTKTLGSVRHAIYQKANRLVKSGELKVHDKIGNRVAYSLASTKAAKISKTQQSPVPTSNKLSKETNVLSQRLIELEYELELCIAEAKGYEDMKSLIPSQLSLLNKKKEEAKKRAIQLNGKLTSTRNIITAITV